MTTIITNSIYKIEPYFKLDQLSTPTADLLVKQGEARVVSAKRKRLLRRRGEYVSWSTYLQQWVWRPNVYWFKDRPGYQKRHPSIEEKVRLYDRYQSPTPKD